MMLSQGLVVFCFLKQGFMLTQCGFDLSIINDDLNL